MDNVQDELTRLPKPDPTAPDRIWQRFRDTREQPVRRVWWMPVGATLAAALLVTWVMWPEQRREAVLDSGDLAWSDQVQLEADGFGRAVGLSKNIEIAWERGTVRAEVVPGSGTKLAIVTDEARIEVVGTAFSVTRDVLGVTTEVERGKVKVTCVDGWSGLVTPEDGPRVCLPVRAGLLLGRADALLDGGAPALEVLLTLDRGLKVAQVKSAVRGELLVRRMRARADGGDREGALADADAYLAEPGGGRSTEVMRFAAYLALNVECSAGLPYLEALEGVGEAADHILLAECLVAVDSARARVLFSEALATSPTKEWVARAEAGLAAIEGR